jgi:hypothetical protein
VRERIDDLLENSALGCAKGHADPQQRKAPWLSGR